MIKTLLAFYVRMKEETKHGKKLLIKSKKKRKNISCDLT